MRNVQHNKPNELNGTHLNSPKHLITTCIHNNHPDYFLTENSRLLQQGKMTLVDYHDENAEYTKENLNSQVIENNHGFNISHIDSSNKYSLDYVNCTGVFAVGTSKETGRNISFLSHQDPCFFLSDRQSRTQKNLSKKELFRKKLKESIRELIEASEKGTIDIVILGGSSSENFQEYKQSIEQLSDIIYEEIGFYPVSTGGPSVNDEDSYEKGVFADTKNRNVYYYKKHKNYHTNISYVANEVETVLYGEKKTRSTREKIINAIKSIFSY